MNSLKVLFGFLIAFCIFSLGLLMYIVAAIGYVQGLALAFAGTIGLLSISLGYLTACIGENK